MHDLYLSEEGRMKDTPEKKKFRLENLIRDGLRLKFEYNFKYYKDSDYYEWMQKEIIDACKLLSFDTSELVNEFESDLLKIDVGHENER